MTEKRSIMLPGRVKFCDHGKPEYLDGAQAQFSVEWGRDSWAWFNDRKGAEIFAKALSAKTPAGR